MALADTISTRMRMRALSADFFGWWWGELRQLLPRSWRARAGTYGDRIVLQVESGELVCLLYRDDQVDGLGRLSRHAADPAQRQAFVNLIAPHLRGKSGATLQLPEHWVVRRQVNLPVAARNNLRQVLGFEMDRQTPFQVAEVYYDSRVLKQSDSDLVAELVAVPRATLDPVLDTIAGLEIPLAVVSVAGHDRNRHRTRRETGVNLLPEERRPPPVDRLATPLNMGLAAAAGLLLVAVFTVPLLQMYSQAAGLRAQVDTARARAEQVAQLRQQLDTRVEQARELLANKNGAPPAVELFAELARILPDDTWLANLELKGNAMLVKGESASSSRLIGLIEASPLFGDTSFVSPITQNPVTGQERFQIALKVKRG